MSRPHDDTTDDEHREVTATISVETVLKALELNDTMGVDDRVIAVPQEDGVEASVRRAFQGSERYANPKNAPVHIRPRVLVDEGFKRPPQHSQARDFARDEFGLAESPDEWDESEHKRVDELHTEQVNVWRKHVRSMIEGEHHLGVHKNSDITLVGERTDE